jgi:DNA-directed RNA polymerase specialized sigma24 family protein
MNDATHEVETRSRLDVTMSRLDEAMARLDPQFRRLMQLWLEGRTRQEIAAETRLCEEAASTIIDAAFKQLRRLLSP